jgi:hypothetical protein
VGTISRCYNKITSQSWEQQGRGGDRGALLHIRYFGAAGVGLLEPLDGGLESDGCGDGSCATGLTPVPSGGGWALVGPLGGGGGGAAKVAANGGPARGGAEGCGGPAPNELVRGAYCDGGGTGRACGGPPRYGPGCAGWDPGAGAYRLLAGPDAGGVLYGDAPRGTI